jgi:hypothetical protein
MGIVSVAVEGEAANEPFRQRVFIISIVSE